MWDFDLELNYTGHDFAVRECVKSAMVSEPQGRYNLSRIVYT